MNSELVSTHVFLYYEDTGKYVIDELAKIYKGEIYLSLVDGNCSNDVLINYARHHFDIKIVYVENCGTDQYGFYHSFKFDDTNKPWIFYCHDKSNKKLNWLKDMLNTFTNIDDELLLREGVGIISSLKFKNKAISFEELLLEHTSTPYEHRKEIVQSMHTMIWLHELQRILLSKYELGEKNFKYPVFSSGNIFLIRKPILEKSHGCVHENHFNKGVYRTDGEVEHGLERFYYYVSNCMRYNNIFI